MPHRKALAARQESPAIIYRSIRTTSLDAESPAFHSVAMAQCEMRWFSQTLQMRVQTTVLIPDDFPPPYSTLYLLHGLSDDHLTWIRMTRLESYASAFPLLIVMPMGFRGFYTDNDAGPAYAQYIGQELVTKIERTFPARPDRISRGLGGNSMGGYGALRIALGFPDRFASAHSHSGALMGGSRNAPASRLGEEGVRIFGNSPIGAAHDLLHLAENAKAAGRLCHLRLDCGVDDFLFADNQEFHARLAAMNVAHDYLENPGNHDWGYWDQQIRPALKFHTQVLAPPG